MREILVWLYHKFSDLKLMNYMADVYRRGFPLGNFQAYLRLRALARRETIAKVINVVFLCNSPTTWNKMSSVYERMCEDKRFKTSILAVPENMHASLNEVYLFFKDMYGDSVVNAKGDKGWVDLKSFCPDYVFFQKPYDNYLPGCYISKRVSRYAKIVYIPYGFDLWESVRGISMCKIFYRNVSILFAENSACKELNINRFKRSHKMGYQKSLFVGYPVFEHFLQGKITELPHTGFRVIWTPRWSEDKAIGKGNFLRFKDEITKLPYKFPEMHIIFRPHPMTFSHFIEVKKMSQEEVDAYLKIYEENNQLAYDKSNDYVSTFWNVDVLLTDISSIIVEFFLTGKPIIYCDAGTVPTEFLSEILKLSYVVHNWHEAEEQLYQLYSGKDPLKKKRQEAIKVLLGEDLEGTSRRILEVIEEDYNQRVGKGGSMYT